MNVYSVSLLLFIAFGATFNNIQSLLLVLFSMITPAKVWEEPHAVPGMGLAYTTCMWPTCHYLSGPFLPSVLASFTQYDFQIHSGGSVY